MGERFSESVQIASVANESGGRGFERARHSNNFYELGLKDLRQGSSERKMTEAEERKAELESLLGSEAGDLLSESDRAALLSVVETEYSLLLAQARKDTVSDASPETAGRAELFKEFLRELFEILKEALLPDETDLALMALPVAGESAIVARRVEKLRKASGRFMEVLRKYEGKGIEKEGLEVMRGIFERIAESGGKNLLKLDDAISAFRWKAMTSDGKRAAEAWAARGIADDLSGMRKQIDAISKEKPPVLEIRVGGEWFSNRLSKFFPKESLWKWERMDIVSKKDELLYEMEQFQLYLKTTQEIGIVEKREHLRNYAETMRTLLNAHGIPTPETTITGLKKAIGNLK